MVQRVIDSRIIDVVFVIIEGSIVSIVVDRVAEIGGIANHHRCNARVQERSMVALA